MAPSPLPSLCLPRGASLVPLAGSPSGYGVSMPSAGPGVPPAVYALVSAMRSERTEMAPLLPVVLVPDTSPSAVADAMRRIVILRDGSRRDAATLRQGRYAGLPIVALDCVMGKVLAGELIKRGSMALVEPHLHLHSPERPNLRNVIDSHTKRVIGTVPDGALAEAHRELYHAQTSEEADKARRKLGRMRRAVKSAGVMALRSG